MINNRLERFQDFFLNKTNIINIQNNICFITNDNTSDIQKSKKNYKKTYKKT